MAAAMASSLAVMDCITLYSGVSISSGNCARVSRTISLASVLACSIDGLMLPVVSMAISMSSGVVVASAACADGTNASASRTTIGAGQVLTPSAYDRRVRTATVSGWPLDGNHQPGAPIERVLVASRADRRGDAPPPTRGLRPDRRVAGGEGPSRRGCARHPRDRGGPARAHVHRLDRAADDHARRAAGAGAGDGVHDRARPLRNGPRVRVDRHLRGREPRGHAAGGV